jgi:hypothetical protein
MNEHWKKDLTCAERCTVCNKKLDKRDQRILSVYSHQPICMTCKNEEERQTDYADMSKNMISECIRTTGKPYGDPEGYCFHHFCPYKC